jgi:hypothetical protein
MKEKKTENVVTFITCVRALQYITKRLLNTWERKYHFQLQIIPEIKNEDSIN